MATNQNPSQIASAAVTSSHDFNAELGQALKEVCDCIMPVWPLKDYVAVNPYFGLADRSFLSARAYLRVFSDCETLMPLSYYSSQYEKGGFRAKDIAAAIQEVKWPESIERYSVSQIVDILKSTNPVEDMQVLYTNNQERRIRTIADYADLSSQFSWSEAIRDEISKICSSHFDQGQACWSSPFKKQDLYTAWKSIAQVDRNLETLGMKGVRKLVASLPNTAHEAILVLMKRLKVPSALWSTVLLCEAFSIPGWCAWTKYQDAQQETGDKNLVALLAIRLAYDLALCESQMMAVNWQSYLEGNVATFRNIASDAGRDAWLRYLLLRATEIHYRDELLGQLTEQEPSTDERSLAQMVFCIDVRSERMRRNIEHISDNVETFGFAGFFGIPMDFVKLGETELTAQLPVLLKPQFRAYESLCCSHKGQKEQVIEKRVAKRTWRDLWLGFQSSSVSCFSFVETAGLLSIGSLLRKSFCKPVKHHHHDGLLTDSNSKSPLKTSPKYDLPVDRQIDIASSILRNLGLLNQFARLVVLCGHHSQTENNPLAAGLDCGACGGHSGAPNARLAANLLNDFRVRQGLKDRDIEIPENTVFLAAVHNTTTDEIEFFQDAMLTENQIQDLKQLQSICQTAREATIQERMPDLESGSPSDLLKRAMDWSEVRPEWGLAGNAAFIVGPRSLTKNLKLNGTSFLHSYDEANDPNGSVLETIMTAPMIVANWINMQYYASTVDNRHFGSGNKTLHNVVGQFGVLSGNSGDLRTGLPLQSLHDGQSFRHLPLRMQVIIAASTASIERIIRKHALVSDLVTNGWLHIVATDGDEHFVYTSEGDWQVIDNAILNHDALPI